MIGLPEPPKRNPAIRAGLRRLAGARPAALAQPTLTGRDFSIARPVVAAHGMVVSQEATASRIGVDILKRGGNAVDAAVAVGFALAVTLPRRRQSRRRRVHADPLAPISTRTIAIDYREAAPAAPARRLPERQGDADPVKSLVSGLGVGVPGTVAGLELAWRKYGSGRLSLADLIAPAARLARQGLTVDQGLADTLPLGAPAAGASSRSGAHLLQARRATARRRRSSRRSTISPRRSTRSPRRVHAPSTKAPIAGKIVAAVDQAGGRMTLEDLRPIAPIEREPVARNLSRPSDRLDAAALVGRRARPRNPEHPRRLSAWRAWAEFGGDDP